MLIETTSSKVIYFPRGKKLNIQNLSDSTMLANGSDLFDSQLESGSMNVS